MYHGELSPIERMELDEEELREFGLDEEGETINVARTSSETSQRYLIWYRSGEWTD